MNRNTENTGLPQSKFYMKVYTIGNEVMLAACDEPLLGRVLKGDEIEFEVSPKFYADILGDEEMLKKHLEMATIGNLVGEKCVGVAIKMGLVDENNVLIIDGVPHAQFAIMF